MNITVDLRSLHSSQYSGVEYFTTNILEHLLRSDKSNQYLLYYNGFRSMVFEHFHFLNVTYKQTRIPNKVLNLAFKYLRWPKFESLSNNNHIVLMPNPNVISLSQGTKLVLVIHDLSPLFMPEMYSFKARIWHHLINLPKLCQRADKIFTVSEFSKITLVKKFGILSSKIYVGALGVEHERYHPNLEIDRLRHIRNLYNLPGKFILFLGTIEPRKNLSRLIEAFENLSDNTHLVLAGKLGWQSDKVLDLISDSKKRHSIHYIGYVSEEDKPYIIKLAKMLAWPSLYEGFGLPLLEAMAVGTPVLTSDVTSMPEVVGDAGLLVNPYSVADITNGLQTILNNKQTRDLLITKSLERAGLFTWQKASEVLQQTLKL